MTTAGISALPPKGGWNVTGQEAQTRIVLGVQRPVEGYTVRFVTGYGVNGSVFVAAENYNAATIQAMIADQVKQLDAVSGSTHDTIH